MACSNQPLPSRRLPCRRTSRRPCQQHLIVARWTSKLPRARCWTHRVMSKPHRWNAMQPNWLLKRLRLKHQRLPAVLVLLSASLQSPCRQLQTTGWRPIKWLHTRHSACRPHAWHVMMPKCVENQMRRQHQHRSLEGRTSLSRQLCPLSQIAWIWPVRQNQVQRS